MENLNEITERFIETFDIVVADTVSKGGTVEEALATYLCDGIRAMAHVNSRLRTFLSPGVSSSLILESYRKGVVELLNRYKESVVAACSKQGGAQ